MMTHHVKPATGENYTPWELIIRYPHQVLLRHLLYVLKPNSRAISLNLNNLLCVVKNSYA